MHDASRQFAARFDSQVLPEAPEVWRTLVRPYADVRIEASPHGFTGEMSGTHLGDSLISRTGCSATMDHRRNAIDVRRSHVDHLLIVLFTSGRVQGEYGKRTLNATPGAIGVLDLGQTFKSRTTSLSTITLTVPRDRLPTSLRNRKLHGAVLDPGLGVTRLLASHMTELLKSAPTLTNEEMTASVNASLMLLGGAQSKLLDSAGDAQQVVREGVKRLVREHIDHSLTSEALSPEQISAAMGLSRSSLYRLFQADGGVQAYIQARKLDRCFDELLLSTGNRITIIEIAYRYGFSSESVFSRAFRRRFGVSPREVRASAGRTKDRKPVGPASPDDEATVRGWLEGIQRTPAARTETST
ncbi:helix-turn-helix domain-containing protein [Pandoraea bronchicola]|uniref:AraC family transcriptional regulator n=1 Tax=Pandoraea bronchicola TaxID=2508287 RepID=A0A5E5BYQ6_9BURK|nr:helix-turn-helix domain-containing protein [Pandoraea bronchicola]VVE90466.1 AraC family transcriptional regulator [Pandoraea bronchicola]